MIDFYPLPVALLQMRENIHAVVQDTDDQNACLVREIDDHMLAKGIKADGWREFGALGGGQGRSGDLV